ncbi:hypothetical protein FKW77_002574 [Venturia effusa]|uniref:Uncharacterized protein n=1 Tax=Venturia effusa TaxID=50376 RepID=A0A517LDF9_9PEZI|nr:hypothetical protein FKW77_002574 [Venturia effusa]
MHLTAIVLLALSIVCFVDAQHGMVGLQPLDPRVLTDLNQYIPEKRIRFKWEIKQKEKGECVCPDPACPDYLNEASHVFNGRMEAVLSLDMTISEADSRMIQRFCYILYPWMFGSEDFMLKRLILERGYFDVGHDSAWIEPGGIELGRGICSATIVTIPAFECTAWS